MNSRSRRILFVSHDSSRTGAPIVLLHLLRWLRRSTDHRPSVVLLEGGELEDEFRRLAPVIVIDPEWTSARSTRERLIRKLALQPSQRESGPNGRGTLEWHLRLALGDRIERHQSAGIGALGPWDLIYLNALPSVRALELIPGDAPVMLHGHELMRQPEYAVWLSQHRGRVDAMRRRAIGFVAASEPVKRGLVDYVGADPAKIDVCHEFVDTSDTSVSEGVLQAARHDIAAPDGTMVVGGVGTTDWRKGADLFLRLAFAARAAGLARPLHFVWVGGEPDRFDFMRLRYDIDEMGLETSVRLLGPRADPRPYFHLFDVLALTSRTDPYPLVCLEAAAQGVPTVAFESGGIPEFIEEDAGFVLRYADTDGMLRRLAEMADDESLRRRLGDRAQTKVRERHDISVGAPRILDSVERALATAVRPGPVSPG